MNTPSVFLHLLTQNKSLSAILLKMIERQLNVIKKYRKSI
jgi:hypothetical protein